MRQTAGSCRKKKEPFFTGTEKRRSDNIHGMCLRCMYTTMYRRRGQEKKSEESK